MAIEAERLIINLEANINQFVRETQKAQKLAEQRMSAIERTFLKANRTISNGFGRGLTKGLDGALANASKGVVAFGRTAGGILAGALALKLADLAIDNLVDGLFGAKGGAGGAGALGHLVTINFRSKNP